MEIEVRAKVGEFVWCPRTGCIAKKLFGISGNFQAKCPKCSCEYRVLVLGEYENEEEEASKEV